MKKSLIPNWLRGGLLIVLLFWLIVLPLEWFYFAIRFEFLPVNAFTGIVRSFWIVGFLIATTIIPGSASSTSVLLRWIIVLLGMLMASPAYFVIGSLLGARSNCWKLFGLFLFVIRLIVGYLLMRAVFYL